MLSHDRAGLALALDAAVFERGDITALLPDITASTLIICGEQDTATPVALSQEMAGLIPAAPGRRGSSSADRSGAGGDGGDCRMPGSETP